MNALITCEVFRTELGLLRSEGVAMGPVEFIPIALHDTPPRMRDTIGAAIRRLEGKPGVENILLAFGLCGGGLEGIGSGTRSVVLPRAHDCISLLLGDARCHELQQRQRPDTYYLSAGWLDSGKMPGREREAQVRERYAGRPQDVIEALVEADRSTFAHFRRVAFIDTGAGPAAEQACCAFARNQGWAYKRLCGTLDWLRSLLTGPWDPERFLVLEPGQRMTADLGGPHLMSAADPCAEHGSSPCGAS